MLVKYLFVDICLISTEAHDEEIILVFDDYYRIYRFGIRPGRIGR